MLQLIQKNGLGLLVVPELLDTGVLVAFTGRAGGASKDVFSSLNLSFNVGDDRNAVEANRSIVQSAVGVPTTRWVVGRQVHGRVIATVGPLEIGRGGQDHESGIPRTDGLVTDIPGVALAVLTADCVPVAMVAPGPVVAVVHAGWRGVMAGVVPVAVRKVASIAGCSAAEATAFIGPHIGACCMEADPAFAGKFSRTFGDSVLLIEEGKKERIDLEAACRIQLAGAGVSMKNIHSAGICTACNEGYFSFRAAGGVCGRQGCLAAIID